MGIDLKSLFLFCVLFTFIFSQYDDGGQLILENEDGYQGSKSGSKTFKVEFPNSMLTYVHVRVSSTSNNNQMLIISENKQCVDRRKQLGIQPRYPINLFMNTEEVKNMGSFYLCIQCQNENSCTYDIEIKTSYDCELNFGEQTSYLVNSYNKNMKFKFIDYDSMNGNIWVKGQSIKSTTELKNGYSTLKGKSFDYGYIYPIKNVLSSSLQLSVVSEEGDFVTVGSLSLTENESKNELKVNELEIMGLLNSDLKEICFPIERLTNDNGVGQINGIIFTKRAKTLYYIDDQEQIIEREIKNGLIFDHILFDAGHDQKYCITPLEGDSDVVFSLQYTSYRVNNYNQLIYSPQLPGVIYSHFLLKGKFAVLRGMKPKKGAKEMHYNMRAVRGYPDMLFSEDKNFPYTQYDENSVATLHNPHHANRMSVYTHYLDNSDYPDFDPISQYQPLIVVQCAQGTNEELSNWSYCEFETTIFSDLDRINLVEYETFSQYLLKGKEDLYTFNIENQGKLTKIYLDLIVFSGDVNLQLDDSNINAHKYYLSNKIYYSIYVTDSDKKIDFTVTAQKNSFYLVMYKLVREDEKDAESINRMESGVNFIQSIYIGEDAKFMKYIEMENMKYLQNNPFLVSFYSQNCKFAVSRVIGQNADGEDEEEFFPFFQNYGQLIIDQNDPYFEKIEYRFRLDITSDDISIYNRKICMIYATGLELSNSDEGTERTISVSEGIPQFYSFSEKYPYIKYTYFVSDMNNQLVISLNLLDKGIYIVRVLHHYQEIERKEIYRNEQIFVNRTTLLSYCQSDSEVCPIDVFIKMISTDGDRRLETTIYQVNGAPIYLPKNAVKQDILLGSLRKYYYLDIGEKETGDITIDYIRGSGYIYAKIVNKLNGDDLENPDWRGMYKFPKTKEESLYYQTYLKKIIISSEDEQCVDGCFVLITVESSVYNGNEDISGDAKLTPYRITITPRVYPSYEYDIDQSPYLIPRVEMGINQFIQGNVYKTGNVIYTYYQLNLPYDSDYVIFDWQADKPSLFIDIGDQRPGIGEEEHSFSFESVGHDSVYRLERSKIIEKAKEKIKDREITSIANLELTLGIWTHESDTLYTSLYAFKIFMPKRAKGGEYSALNEIIHIRSDQKVQCDPLVPMDSDIYTCIFAVVFDEGDIDKTLIVYPKAQMENLQIKFYGSIVDAELVEKNDLSFISSHLNEEDSEFSSVNKKYIYYEHIDKKKSVLFKVTSSVYTIIEVISSIYIYDENAVFVPNPSTPQVFSIGENKIFFNFETSQDLLINVFTISGDGRFYWELEDEKNIRYYLNGFGDRLSLTSGTYERENSLSKLVAESTTFTIFEEDNSGFVFYITFYPRNNEYNMDQIKIGRSTEFDYRDVHFPLNFFTKLTDKNIAVSFTFYNYFMDKTYQLEYDKSLFNIWAKVITEKQALEARIAKELMPSKDNSIGGSFDGHFGTVFLNEEDIKKFNIKDEDNPYLFLSLETTKAEEFPYNGISVEVSVLKENQLDDFAPEYVYLNGKLSNKENINNPQFVYKLKTNPANPAMRIEFSANSHLVKWEVYKDEGLNYILEEEKVYLNGRYMMTFEVPEDVLSKNQPLYLKIFNDDATNINPKLGNYVFKYMNGLTKLSFYDFPQENDLLEYSIYMVDGKKNYDISFTPVYQFDVNYYVKAVYSDTKIQGEREDTIAISESEGYYLQVDNPLTDEEGKKHLIFTIPDENRQISYVKILAKVNFFSVKEFLLYKPVPINEDDIKPDVDYSDLKPNSEICNLNYKVENNQIKHNVINAFRVQRYVIKVDDMNVLPNYIKVKTISKEEKNQILYFSPTDSSGKENRLQLGQSGEGTNVTMWITKQQIENNNFYVVVECQDEEKDRCNYLLEIVGYKYVVSDTCIFTYNYYVSANNKVMVFAINNDLGFGDSDNQILTLYANGGKDIKLTLGNCAKETCKQHKYRTGAAITTTIQKHNFFELTVEAEEGDFISVGSKVTLAIGVSFENDLKPNNYQFTGYLKKGVLDRECYTIPKNYGKVSYIVGMFYNNAAEVYFNTINFEKIEGTNQLITNGYYTYVHDENKPEHQLREYICVEFPESGNYMNEDLPYSLQLTQPQENIGLLNIYGPQLRGNIYPRIMPKGSIVFFNGANLKSDSDQILYNMMVTEGLPKMYIYKCLNYPLCKADLDNFFDVVQINEINRMSTWFYQNFDNEVSPISPEQYVMFVKCEDLENSSSDICQFQTSIYGNKDEIYLIERQPFSQYIYANQKTRYVIDLSLEESFTKAHVDTFVVNGDVSFDVKNQDLKDIKYHKYYLANKIFYSINLSENYGIKKIIVDIVAKVNSFYTIEYKIVSEKDELQNDIYTGINYLIPILPSKNANTKKINVHNIKLLANDFYFVSFYSLNCDFKISKTIDGKEQQISSYVKYAQDVIDDENKQIVDTHSYQVTVVETDLSKYTNNMCMLFVSGLEITQEKSIAQKEILISEGIPQKVVFNKKLNRIMFIYPNPDKEKNLAIYIKVINPAQYSYTVDYNHFTKETGTFYQSTVKYIDKIQMNINCKSHELCSLIITINVIKEIDDNVPIIELSAKQISNVPYYIPKGIAKQDFVPANSWLYLFTTLGQEDEGYITVDFARGSGEIYAKIVEINDEGDSDPDWRQFKFPKSKDDPGSLYYEFYNKRLTFTNEQTYKCVNGCYLLIALKSSVGGKFNEQYRFHQISITVSLTPIGELKQVGHIIQIEPEQYVVGSLSNEDKIKKQDMYEFYQVAIPFDAEKVQFDWQSDSAILLINIGEKRPTLDNHHFIKESIGDSVYELNKNDIQSKIIDKVSDGFITIGVYTNIYESIFGTAYSFRVHFIKKLNIYKVNSDQKAICKPEKLENSNEYSCLFMVAFGELDFINDLMIYSKSQSPSALVHMYGEFISNEIYDSLDYDKLKSSIPNEKSKYNTKRDEIDFIFLTSSVINSHFYVKVVSDKSDNIEFITSLKTFDEELSPNPTSIQLFSINYRPSMTLKLVTRKPLLINIVSLYGSSKVYMKDESSVEYILRGRDDRLALAIPSITDKEKNQTVLVIEDKSSSSLKLNDGSSAEKPLVAFYVEYYIRSNEVNLDEIYFGKTSEFAYKKSDFPLYYYSKCNDYTKTVNAFFILHDLEFETPAKEYNSNDFVLRGSIVPQKTIYLVKLNEEAKPNVNKSPVKGIFDPALKVGQIIFSEEDSNTFNIKSIENPNIYLSIEKDSSIAYKLSKIRLELTAIQENNEVPVTEKLYQYGKLKDKKTINYYRLKVGNSKGYMRIQFSTNSKCVSYAVNNEKNQKENSKYDELTTKTERGKTFITFKTPNDREYIYLNVFLKDESRAEEVLNNYAFKYINADSKDKFFEYKISSNDPKLSKSEENNKIVVKFKKIEGDNLNIVYSLKCVESGKMQKELLNTIAITETDSYVVDTKNNKDETISLSIDKNNKNYEYFQVIAQIIDGPIIEYVSYEPLGDFSFYDDFLSNSTKSSNKKTLYIIIGVSVGLLIIVVILVLVIFTFNARNKDLMDQVQKISFVTSGAKPKDDTNLLLDNQNELS